MLSICIPVYNQDVTPLAKKLHNQAVACKANIEIIIIDDASAPDISFQNQKNCQAIAKYITLEKNVGRAKIRNLFTKYTKNPFLLFIDGDVTIKKDDFLARYIHLIRTSDVEVATGGHQYTAKPPGKNYALRWKYGLIKETQEAAERRLHPYRSFKTSNFIIKHTVFNDIKFNEQLTDYGHEDTLFGYELKCQQVKMLHIDNPVYIEKPDSNRSFMHKTRQSLCSLTKVAQIVEWDSRFIKDIKILHLYYKIKKYKLTPLLIWSFLTLKPVLELYLNIGVMISLKVYNFYKLGYFCTLQQKNKGSSS